MLGYLSAIVGGTQSRQRRRAGSSGWSNFIQLLAVVASVAPGQVSAEDRWEGYRAWAAEEVQKLNLPFADFAENSVFKMETVGVTNTPGEMFRIVDIESIPQETDPAVLSDPLKIVRLQIETCRKQGLRYCPILTYSKVGTAFFNRGRLLTCRHGFHNWISLASQHNSDRSVREISPPMILRNSTGDIVYNSAYDAKPLLKFLAINDDARLNYQTEGNDYPSRAVAAPVFVSEYVEMGLGEPFDGLADSALNEHTFEGNVGPYEVFSLGYPSEKYNAGTEVALSSGGILLVSSGRIDGIERSFLRTTNYSTPGMSGAPLITIGGVLVGVHCKSSDNSNAADVRSFGFPIGKSFAEEYWRSLDYPSQEELSAAESLQQAQHSP